MSNKDTISAIYEAFLRNDIPFILNQLTDDVKWNYAVDNTGQKAGLPWLKLYSGRDDVSNFFTAVAEMGIYQFDILTMLENETQVVSKIDLKCKYFDDQIVHFWTFNDEGKVVCYEQVVDTAKQIRGYENATKSAVA